MTVRDLEAQATRKNREAAKARKTLRAAKKAERPDRVEHRRAVPVAKGQREPRLRDPAFLQWLRRLPCIACETELRLPSMRWDCGRVQAAHQKLAIASKGWREGGLGPRVDDQRACPICEWHHLLAPDACDKGQRAFWRRLFGDEAVVADLCADLFAAFKANADGAEVIRAFAAQRGEYSRHERLNTKPSIPEPKATR
jgi:hypothetical protein